MALSDDCSEFVDDLRPKLSEFAERIREYHGAPWQYDPKILTTVRSATEHIHIALDMLEAVRRELDAPPVTTRLA